MDKYGVIKAKGPTFYPDTDYTMKYKCINRDGTAKYDIIKYPGIIVGTVRIPPHTEDGPQAEGWWNK